MAVSECSPLPTADGQDSPFLRLRLAYPSLRQKDSLLLGQTLRLSIPLQFPRHAGMGTGNKQRATTVTIDVSPSVLGSVGYIQFLIPAFEAPMDALKASVYGAVFICTESSTACVYACVRILLYLAECS